MFLIYLIIILVMTFVFVYYFLIIFLIQWLFGNSIVSEMWFFNTDIIYDDWNYYEFSSSLFALISMSITTFSLLMILDMFISDKKIIFYIFFSYILVAFFFNLMQSSFYWTLNEGEQNIYYKWNESPLSKTTYYSSLIFPHLWTTSWFTAIESKSWIHLSKLGDWDSNFMHYNTHLIDSGNSLDWNMRLLMPWILLFVSILLKSVNKIFTKLPFK